MPSRMPVIAYGMAVSTSAVWLFDKAFSSLHTPRIKYLVLIPIWSWTAAVLLLKLAPTVLECGGRSHPALNLLFGIGTGLVFLTTWVFTMVCLFALARARKSLIEHKELFFTALVLNVTYLAFSGTVLQQFWLGFCPFRN